MHMHIHIFLPLCTCAYTNTCLFIHLYMCICVYWFDTYICQAASGYQVMFDGMSSDENTLMLWG